MALQAMAQQPSQWKRWIDPGLGAGEEHSVGAPGGGKRRLGL